MSFERLANVVCQLRHPRRATIMVQKIQRRFEGRAGELSKEQNLEWLKQEARDFGALAQGIDEGLWRESLEVADRIQHHGDAAVAQLGVPMGGGAYLACLYFIARKQKPTSVVETGVAAGFSSAALLEALTANGLGTLWSSDFPYVRLRNPERFIGVAVRDELRSRWRLFIEGDDKNLPLILASNPTVDLFHYDSDKSYAGRVAALQRVDPHLREESILVMDDIQDNSFFHDWVLRRGGNWIVTFWNGKYVGIAGFPCAA